MSGEYSNSDYLERVERSRIKLKKEKLKLAQTEKDNELLEITKTAYNKSSAKNKIAYAEAMRNKDLRRFL